MRSRTFPAPPLLVTIDSERAYNENMKPFSSASRLTVGSDVEVLGLPARSRLEQHPQTLVFQRARADGLHFENRFAWEK